MSRIHTAMLAAILAGTSHAALAQGVGTSTTGVGFSANGAQVQVNIDNTKVVDTDSSINVTKTINGENVGYGLGGASVVGILSQRSSDAQAVIQERQANVQNIQNQAYWVAAALQATGY